LTYHCPSDAQYFEQLEAPLFLGIPPPSAPLDAPPFPEPCLNLLQHQPSLDHLQHLPTPDHLQHLPALDLIQHQSSPGLFQNQPSLSPIQQELPSLSPSLFRHQWSLDLIQAPTYATAQANHTSDLTSDARSQSESQTPAGSTTSHRRQRPANDSKGMKPTSLSYYRSTAVYAPLAEAKDYFAATAFSSGHFFYHQRSHHLETFRTYARDAVALAAKAHSSTCSNLYCYFHHRCSIISVLITSFS
jgi:hypothetical protein